MLFRKPTVGAEPCRLIGRLFPVHVLQRMAGCRIELPRRRLHLESERKNHHNKVSLRDDTERGEGGEGA